MIADFLGVSDPRWPEVLRRVPHDVFHLPEYLRHAARFEGGTPLAFHAHDSDGELLIPLLIRPLPTELGAPGDWCDVVTPYGYPGPVVRFSADAADTANQWLARGLSAFRTSARARGVVSAFFRWHPLFAPSGPVAVDGHQLKLHGHTVYVDLSLSDEQLHLETRSSYRYAIRKLAKAGFQVMMDDWSHCPRFIELYAGTMRRVSASDFYFFSDSYFDELRRSLGARLHLGAVIAPTGELASAAFFTEFNGIVQYHLAATDERFLRQAPSKMLMDFARRWAKQRGNRYLHLGGGLGGREDSLLLFKLGFSKRRAEYYTSRMVLAPDRYAQLVGDNCAPPPTTESADDFFPAYRKAA